MMLQNYNFPLLSNVRFGNELWANLGGSSATITGINSAGNNFDYLNSGPVIFDFDRFLEPYRQPKTAADLPELKDVFGGLKATGAATASGAESLANTQFSEMMKLSFLAITALLLIGIGLFAMIERKYHVSEKVIGAAKTAATKGAM